MYIKMINFVSLKIRDFKSIKQAELTFDKGVWLVSGVNNDSSFSSNGSGKTTSMEALQQCLFNRTTGLIPIEDVSRKVQNTNVRHNYELEVEFYVNDIHYRIVNSRELMSITIYKDYKDLRIKTIPIALKYIQTILNMDFNTFVTLTMINHDTVVDMLDNFSSSSLMKVILNFSKISDFEKLAKAEYKIVDAEIYGIQGQIQTVQDSLSILNQFTEIDLSPMFKEKLRCTQLLANLEGVEVVKLEAFELKVTNAKQNLDTISNRILHNTKKLNESTCSCCQTLLTLTQKEKEALQSTTDVLSGAKRLAEESYSVLSLQATNERSAYKIQHSSILLDLENINTIITVARTKNQMYEDSKNQADNLREKQVGLSIALSELQIKSDVIRVALSVIRSGDIQKDLLNTFIGVLNVHLNTFIKFISLDYIYIKAVAVKGSVSFSIVDTRFNQHMSIYSLSGGEKTRLRLVVLLAMLYTIKNLADISTNLLVFDESLDTLDSSATKDLANLFSYLLSNDNKFIAMISHGAQLSEVEFTGDIIATKTKGVTKITKEIR